MSDHIPLPIYLKSMPKKAASRARVAFILRAALAYSGCDSMRELGALLGCPDGALYRIQKLRTPKIPARTALRLEKLLGDDLFPKEFTCPEVFLHNA